MKSQKYSVNQQLIENLLAWVTSGEIAIPEIQRPFVWSASKVRDLMDSLYQGFPVGYIIAWRNPVVTLKDGCWRHAIMAPLLAKSVAPPKERASDEADARSEALCGVG